MARRTILLSEVNLTEESVNQDVSGNLTVTGTSTFTGAATFNGNVILGATDTLSFDGGNGTYLYESSDNVLTTVINNNAVGSWTANGLNLVSAARLDWNSDTILVRDAANVLAMKNSTTAQTVRIYGDATAATLKYLTLTHDGTNGLITTSGGTFGFGTHTTSAGTNINGVTGYISIVDSGGTPRRLAVLT